MPRKGDYVGRQKSIILSNELQAKLEEIKKLRGSTTDADTFRFLILDYYEKNIEKKRKKS